MRQHGLPLPNSLLHPNAKGTSPLLPDIPPLTPQAASPIATLLATWAFRLRPVSYSTLSNILVIALGVAIASYGEVSFNTIGIILQLGGVVFEALRIVMVQKLLTPRDANETKMEPLVSLYYFAPACAVMNGLLSLVVEGPRLTLSHVLHVGYATFGLSALVAFTLNVITVLVVSHSIPYYSYREY